MIEKSGVNSRFSFVIFISIAKVLEEKLLDGQADRFVLNLKDSPVSIEALSKQLSDYPIEGLKEVIVIGKSGEVIPFYPFSQ